MKKSNKNNYNKKTIKNKCLVNEDSLYESTNREILESTEKPETDYKECKEIKSIENESGENETEEIVIPKMTAEDFKIKLFMLVKYS